MNIRDRQGLKQTAAQHLKNAAYDPRKLSVIHSSLIVGIALVLSLLSVILSQGIAGTGGLSGIGTRNLLQTAESALQLAYTFLTPFWQVGIVFAFLCIIRSHGSSHAAKGMPSDIPSIIVIYFTGAYDFRRIPAKQCKVQRHFAQIAVCAACRDGLH